MKIEYDYKGSLNMTKLSQIDRIHVLVKSIFQSKDIKSDDCELFSKDLQVADQTFSHARA